MLKYFFTFVLILTAISFGFSSGDPKDKGFVITGKIKGFTYPYIYFAHTEDGVSKLDSCAVKGGTFKFTGKVSEPEMVFLHTKDRRLQKVFYAENVNMQVEGDFSALDRIVIKGSKVQDDYAELETQIQAHRNRVMNLYNASEAAKNAGDSVKMKELLKHGESLYRMEYDIRMQFILTHPHSPAALQELMVWTNEANYRTAKTLYYILSPEVKSLKKAKEVAQRLDNLETVDLGNAFQDFTQNDIDGKPVSLSSYKGKYVLLEFWASWCGPCRAENPNLKQAYSKYKDKGLNILGVSLDDNEARWKNALEKDNLPWAQVSDLKGWRNEAAVKYGIQAIPANFLIDPQGKIVHRNLRGEELNKVLEKIFN